MGSAAPKQPVVAAPSTVALTPEPIATQCDPAGQGARFPYNSKCEVVYKTAASDAPPASSAFVGRFKTDCKPDGGWSWIFTNEFGRDKAHRLIGEVYAGDQCKPEALLQTFERKGTYAIVGPAATEPGAFNIDFNQPQLTIHLRTNDLAAEYNAGARCGKTDWKANEPYTFETAACKVPVVTNTINKVEAGPEGDRLYVGNFNGKREPDADKRPLTLDRSPGSFGKRF